MKKKQIDWETLKYIAIVAQDNECDGCDICRQDTCPLWASLEDVGDSGHWMETPPSEEGTYRAIWNGWERCWVEVVNFKGRIQTLPGERFASEYTHWWSVPETPPPLPPTPTDSSEDAAPDEPEEEPEDE